nr:aldo/keto reductase [Sediminibacillus halophilus]
MNLAASILEKKGLELSAVQYHYSLLYRASEDAGNIDGCNQHDVLFFTYMELEQGALTGKVHCPITLLNQIRGEEKRSVPMYWIS